MNKVLYSVDWQMLNRFASEFNLDKVTAMDIFTYLYDEEIIPIERDIETDEYKRGWNDAIEEAADEASWEVSSAIRGLKYRRK